MEAAFWHRRWQKNEIAFHEEQPNAMLVRHCVHLLSKKIQRVFVPLCGKSTDLAWFLDQGVKAVGIELNESAVQELFRNLGLTPKVTEFPKLIRYRANNLEIFVGDIFDLTDLDLGAFDAIYDRAALVALPAKMRSRYVQHMLSISNIAPQLLISYDYDQSQTEGPPFSVPHADIQQLYGECYQVKLIDSQPISGLLAKRCSGYEVAWLLEPQ